MNSDYTIKTIGGEKMNTFTKKIFIWIPFLVLFLSGCEIIPSFSSSSGDTSSLDGLPYETTITTKNISGNLPNSYSSDASYFNKDDVHFYSENIINDFYEYGFYKKDDFIMRSSENLDYRQAGWVANLNSLNEIKSFDFTGIDNNCLPSIHLGAIFGEYTFKVDLTSDSYTIPSGKYKFFKIVGNENIETHFSSLTISWNSKPSPNIQKAKRVVDVVSADKNKVETSITTVSTNFSNSAYWQSLGYAINYDDAMNRTNNKAQSGSNKETDYIPSSATSNPQNSDGIYYRVSTMNYGDNGNSFRINTLDGSEGPVIYKEAAYTNIEDIAAYVVAFGDVPPNMQFLKNQGSSAINNWGENGRVNYTYYSNDNSSGNYRYETECLTHSQYFSKSSSSDEYWYHYFESDVGATLFNDEPYQRTTYSGSLRPYNDGYKITRGALRFVWTKGWTNSEHGKYIAGEIEESYERNIYYTSNHYNDFQQYLNYYGGWSGRVGNTENGNEWNEYVANNHTHMMPVANLVTLADLRSKL